MAFKFLFSAWSSLSLIEVGNVESNTQGCSRSIFLSFMILWHPLAFQKGFIELKRFSLRRLVPVEFRCKPLLPRFLVLILLLSIMSLSSWRRWSVSWITVNAAFSSSVRKVGVEIITSQLGRLSVIKYLSVRRLSNIFRDVEYGASSVPAWITRKLGYLRRNGRKWCFMSSTVAPFLSCSVSLV